MLIVSGVMRSGTTWVAKVCADLLGKRLVSEPFNVNGTHGGDYPDVPDWMLQKLNALRPAFHRFAGHNDSTPTGQRKQDLLNVMRSMERAYPGCGVAKVMILPYCGLLLEVWPEARIVYVVRGLASWLSCVARTEWVLPALCESPWDCDTPWHEAGHLAARGDETREPLYVAAAFRQMMLSTHIATLEREAPGRYFVVDYEGLSAGYEVRVPELAGYIGAVAPTEEKALQIAQPVARSFEGAPFTAMDVAEVARRLET